MYGDVPPAGIVNVPPSIPTGMLYRCKSIAGVSKQTLKLVPLSGQTNVANSQKVIVSLPPNSLVDLSTFEMNFTGATQHRGNSVAGGSSLASNCANYVQKAYFPRNTTSLIENLEIKINGQSRQNINQYGYIFNVLLDYTCGFDSVGKNRIGCNSDPSCKSYYNAGQCTRFAGFPAGCTTSDTTISSHLDQDVYTIRQWLGILGRNASTSIIDTSLYGDITIELTLAPSDCLILSAPVGTLATYASATNGEVGLTTTVGSAAAATEPQGTGYNLSNIGFQITRYDMPASYYNAVASVLESGAVFKLYFPNYSTFLGTGYTLGSGSTTRFTIATQSLDMVIHTRQVQDRGTQQAPILGKSQFKYTNSPF